jgi:hypothetical protein
MNQSAVVTRITNPLFECIRGNYDRINCFAKYVLRGLWFSTVLANSNTGEYWQSEGSRYTEAGVPDFVPVPKRWCTFQYICACTERMCTCTSC